MKPTRRRVLAAGTSILLFLLLTEAGLRAFGDRFWSVPLIGEWDWIVSDPLLGWRNQKGLVGAGFRINSLGLRGDEIAARKPPGALRIVCLGDSVTFGVRRDGPGVHGWENWPEELAALLNQRGHDGVEVVNAGVIGYTSSHGLRQLETELLDLEPDVIAVRYGFNAHAPSWHPSLRVREPESSLARFLLYRFSDSGLLRLVLYARQRMAFLHPPPFAVPWTGEERFERDLRRFVEAASEENARLLFIDYPIRSLERGDSLSLHKDFYPLLGVETLAALHERHGRYERAVREVAAQTNTPLIDTAARCHAAGGRCFNDYDVVHPTPFGARLIAEVVYGELQSRGWLR